MRTFSKTVSLEKILTTWNERVMPFLHVRCAGSPVMSSPLKMTWPPSGESMPVMRLKSVVFPAPFGPMTATISPSATSRLAPFTALKPPNDLCRFLTCSIPLLLLSTFRRSPFPNLEYVTEQALGQEKNHEHQQYSQDQCPVVGKTTDKGTQRDGDGGSKHGTEKGKPASQKSHDSDLKGERPEHHVGEDRIVHDHKEHAGDTAKKTRDHDRRQLVTSHIDAHGLAAHSIIPDSL